MVPVVEKQVTEIDIVIRSRRAIDQYATKQSIPCLYIKVRMIPRGPVLGCAPFVCEAISWSDWTLSNAGNAIVVVCVVLSYTMEVNRSSVVLKCIGHMHDLKVSLSAYYFLFAKEILKHTYRPSRPSQR